LYYKIDEQMITKVLRWLNKAAAKDRRLFAIKDKYKLRRALQALFRTDYYMRVAPLIRRLNYVDHGQGEDEIRGQVLGRANNEIRECLVFPQIRTLGDGERAVFFGAAPGGSGKVRAYREIVSKILYLYSRGLLSSVRECAFVKCGQWFHATHGKSRFHSNRCRNRAHYANLPPKSKAHRRKEGREYMRKYRADEKEKTERELQRAKERN
jgi:hypothetical protein